MSADTFDPNVPESEILADETIRHAEVAVVLRRPVRTQQLPTELAGLTTLTLGTTGAVVVSQAARVNGNPRQRRVTLFAFDQEIRLGSSEAAAESDQAARWPKLVPLTMETRDEFWIAAATDLTVVSLIREFWTE